MVGPGETQNHINTVFERLVLQAEDDQDRLEGMIAYARYKEGKREWAREIWDSESRKPTDDELKGYSKTWTLSRLSGAKIEARNALEKFAGEVIDANRHSIERDALRGKFWNEVGAAILGAILYSVILIAVVFGAGLVGIDLFHVIQNIGAPRPH